MKRKSYTFALTLLLLAGLLSCSKIMPERNIDYSGGRVFVNLPRGLRNAETDRNLDKPTAVVISLPNNDEIYVGAERTASAKEDLRFKLRQLLQDQAEPDRIVYLGAGFTNDYGSVVGIVTRSGGKASLVLASSQSTLKETCPVAFWSNSQRSRIQTKTSVS